MGVAKKIKRFMKEGSWIRRMFEEGIALKHKYGEENVYDLSLGNPVMEPPPQFQNELLKLIKRDERGMHRYMPNAGYYETRSAVANQLSIDTGISFVADEIMMSCGAGGGLNVVFKTLLEPGDEVVIFAPYFVEYMFYVDNHGGTCSVVPPDSNFCPDFSAFESILGPRTRVVLVSSPGNPTGVVYSADVLAHMAQIIKRKEDEFGSEIFLVSDEPYRKIIFDSLPYPYIFEHHERSITITSHSKDLALPGERIGFVAVNPKYKDRDELMDGLTFCNRTLGFVNASALMQRVITSLQGVVVDIGKYQDKRDFLYESLTDIGYQVIKPQGAFYMFPTSPIKDDTSFVSELLTHRVLVVPGRGFGMPGHFRISYCVADQTLKSAIGGFQAAFERFNKTSSVSGD